VSFLLLLSAAIRVCFTFLQLRKEITLGIRKASKPSPSNEPLGNPKDKSRLGREWIESSPEEKDLGMLVGRNLNMTQQCVFTAPQANGTLGCIPSTMGTRAREGILSLCATLMRPHRGVLHPALEPSAQDRPGAVGAGPEDATAMMWGLEPLCCEERLGELGLFSLEKRKLRGDLRAAFQCLEEPVRELERDFL